MESHTFGDYFLKKILKKRSTCKFTSKRSLEVKGQDVSEVDYCDGGRPTKQQTNNKQNHEGCTDQVRT